MSDAFYGGAPNAFAGGQEFAAVQRQRRHQENALKSLIAQYGPEAADPAAMAQLQGIDQREQLFPHQLGAAERSTAANEALVETHGPVAGDPTALASQTTADTRLQSAGLNFARMLQASKRKNGDLGAAFDRGIPVLTAMGMPTEQLAGLREHLLSNPDFVDEFASLLVDPRARQGYMGAPIPVYDQQGRAALYDHSTGDLIPGVRPAATVLGEARVGVARTNAALRSRALTNEEARDRGFKAPEGHQIWEDPETGRIYADPIPGTSQDRTARTENAETIASQAESLRGLGAAVFDAEQVERWGKRALMTMDATWIGQQNLLSGAARRSASRRPGTVTYEIAQDLDNIRGVVAIDELLRIKARGGTLGQVTEQELLLLKNKLGSLDVTRDPARLRADVEQVLLMYQRIAERSQGEIQRLRGSSGVPGRYGPPVAPPPAAGQRSLDDILRQYGAQ